MADVVAGKVEARLIAEGTYLDVLHTRHDEDGEGLTNLEQYAAEEWLIEARRRGLHPGYRLLPAHIKYVSRALPTDIINLPN